MKIWPNRFIRLFLLLYSPLALGTCNSSPDYPRPAKNLILIIGDGMGWEQINAAGLYAEGTAGTLSFESLPYITEMTTHSADSAVTDSAAAATALATGRKVNNGVISKAIPGTGEDLKTLLEAFKEAGKSTGLVSTAYITHATPAAFGAHAVSRNNYSEIADGYLTSSRPNILFGGGGNGLDTAALREAGYTVCENLAELNGMNETESSHFGGLFGTDHLPYQYDGLGNLPELSDMALKAVAILEEDSDGFFLMIEAGRIDHAGHANDLIRNIHEVLELSDTVEKIMAWAGDRDDTLIIVTADHETGGLTVIDGNGMGNLPSVTWSTTGHTGQNVPVFLWGREAESLALGIADNTDIFPLIGEN